jgi:hypothetical protein
MPSQSDVHVLLTHKPRVDSMPFLLRMLKVNLQNSIRQLVIYILDVESSNFIPTLYVRNREGTSL